LVVPEFDTLVGLLTSISIMGMNTWTTTLAWEWGGRKYRANRVLMWILCVICNAFDVSGLAGSFYQIVTKPNTPTITSVTKIETEQQQTIFVNLINNISNVFISGSITPTYTNQILEK
jgi:hypothetical protein